MKCPQLQAVAALALTWSASALGQERIDSYILVDQLEHGFTKGSDTLRFNGLGWAGGDYNRLWVNTQGNRTSDGSLADADVQVLYGRLIAPFWDLQGGVRYYQPLQNGPKRGAAVFGIQGLAPYRFEVQAAGFVSNRGEVSARIEIEYDIRLTQRLVAQPRFEANVALQRVKELGVGRGINDTELGMRVRYEIRREFAPYAGIVWNSKFGEAAEFARLERQGDPTRNLALVVGVRFWR